MSNGEVGALFIASGGGGMGLSRLANALAMKIHVLLWSVFVLIACTDAGVEGDLPVDGGPGGGTSAGGGAGGGVGTGGGGGVSAAIDVSVMFEAGARLRPRWLNTADGAKRFLSWFDTLRNQPCDWSNTEDGVVRCVPPAEDVSIFLDAACTQPALLTNASCTQGLLRVSPGSDPAQQLAEFYQVGAEVPVPSEGLGVYSRSGTDCVPLSVAQPARVYAAGTAISSTDFVSSTLNVRVLNAALNARYREGSDGSVSFTRLVDSVRLLECLVDQDKNQFWRCLPLDGVIAPDGQHFSDSSCTARVAQRGSAPVPQVARRGVYVELYNDMMGTVGAAYIAPWTIFSVGAPLSAMYSTESGTCAAATPCSGCFAVGAEVSPSAFIAASIQTETFGRLERRGFELGGNVRINQSNLGNDFDSASPDGQTWWDTILNTFCEFSQVSEGAWRCLPKQSQTATAWGTLFADAQCQQPAAMGPFRGSPQYATQRSAGCGSYDKVFALTGTHAGPVYLGSAGGCVPYTVPAMYEKRTVYLVGAEVPASSFVAATVSTD